MIPDPSRISRALLESLRQSPLLIEDLPEAPRFSRASLALPPEIPQLNLHQKLGHLYEDALAVLLEASPSIELLAQSLQIRKDIHTTVGELDYLLRDLEKGQLIHLELATKFYLAVETGDGLTLPGPDARDNYHKKLDRLRQHQLRLPRIYQEFLPEIYRGETIQTQQLIYGCLFDHIHADAPAQAHFSNPRCRRGQWLYQSECAEFFPKGSRFQLIPKSLWPVPFDLLDGITLEGWTPEPFLERCQMIRVNNDPAPYFIAPASYPLNKSPHPKIP